MSIYALRARSRHGHAGHVLALVLASTALASAGLTLVPSRAFAQRTADDLARQHFESGKAYFSEAEYADALRAFRKAFELSHRTPILLNIAVVEERLGNLSAAVSALDQYLEQTPDASDIETTRKRRDNLQKRLEEQELLAHPPPPPEPEVQVPEAAQPKPAMAPEREWNWLSPPVILWGVGAASAVGALATGLAANSKYQDLQRSCKPNCSNDEIGSTRGLAAASTVLTGITVLAAGVGTWLWFSPFSDKTHTVSLTPLPGGAMATLRF